MSLINDALKRARQAQHRNPPPPVPVAPLRPVEVARPRPTLPGMLLPVALVAVLVLVCAVVLAVGWRGAGMKSAPMPTEQPVPSTGSPVTASTPIATQPNPEPSPATLSAPSVSIAAALETSTPRPTPETRQVRAQSATSNAPAVVSEAPATAPVWPKLQGIFYRPDRPSALLNGKSFSIGERTGDFLVVAIDRRSVTLARAGVTNILRLAE